MRTFPASEPGPTATQDEKGAIPPEAVGEQDGELE